MCHKKKSGCLVVWMLAFLIGLVFLSAGCTKTEDLSTPAPGRGNSTAATSVDADIDIGGEPFSLTDCYVLGVSLGMPEQTVLGTLGEPWETTITFCEARASYVKTLHYYFGTLSFSEDHLLESFEVHTEGADGPRGIQVGDNIQSVIVKFPHEQKALEGENPRWATKTLYGSTMHGQAGGGIYYEAYEIIYADGDYGITLRVEIENGEVSRFRCFFAVT